MLNAELCEAIVWLWVSSPLDVGQGGTELGVSLRGALLLPLLAVLRKFPDLSIRRRNSEPGRDPIEEVKLGVQ